MNKRDSGSWRGSRKPFWFKYLVEFAFVLLLSGIFTFGFCQKVKINENSMKPVLREGDTVLIDRLTVHLFRVKRNDLVAYRISDRDDGAVHVKRVIGMPGDTIEIIDGFIYVNDAQATNVGATSASAKGLIRGKIKLSSNEYFLVGDNLDESQDSRFSDIGNITAEKISGRVWFISSPLKHIGFPR
ncbi:MAG: signal peptidase I [Lachnospiraceae bacterium]|nr:signal peptidase I [Lachnospiraceae bacterium]